MQVREPIVTLSLTMYIADEDGVNTGELTSEISQLLLLLSRRAMSNASLV